MQRLHIRACGDVSIDTQSCEHLRHFLNWVRRRDSRLLLVAWPREKLAPGPAREAEPAAEAKFPG